MLESNWKMIIIMLLDYKIQSESSIHCVSILRRGMLIFVKIPTGKIITLEVEELNIIEDVRERIRDIEGIPPENYYLINAARNLQDGCTLFHYGIQNESILYLMIKYVMQIFVMTPSGKTIILEEVCVVDTIESIKTKIQDSEGIPPDQQKLHFLVKN